MANPLSGRHCSTAGSDHPQAGCEKVKAKYPAENLAIIDSNNLVHMAHMDIHYGFSINGVAALHTEITEELRAASVL